MQIGEFALLCKTKISVLRYYDQKGILTPAYLDDVTGYRHYTHEQAMDFERIDALKRAGFSLAEIGKILEMGGDDAQRERMFTEKAAELGEMIKQLAVVRQMMGKYHPQICVKFMEKPGGMKAWSEVADKERADDARAAIQRALNAKGYQRISAYRQVDSISGKSVKLMCDVVKLHDKECTIRERCENMFVNDETVVGRWGIIGEYASMEDFEKERKAGEGELLDDIYFLPGGETYWCYGWTQGELIIDDGVNTTRNPYTTQKMGADRYMFIMHKGEAYRRGGKEELLVLKQLDNRAYGKLELARKDDIEKPFVGDERVLGLWKAVDLLQAKEAFDPRRRREEPLYFDKVEFLPQGEAVSWYGFGKEKICGREEQEWTNGYLLRKWNSCACAYEIRTIDGMDYLLMEWKSGDYRYGGKETDYYVFIRT